MYNSDGYVMIDMSDVDITRSSQNIPGIYKRVLEVIDTNKLALIVNAGNNTPMAAVVHKKLNYYKITTLLYIFTINTNDIVIVEESGEATVDVEIVPTLTEGTKIADFSIGSIEGELFAPPQETEINDNVTAVNSTWSSTKISNELSDKAEAADVYTKAQVDTALALKADTSDIPTKTSELLNDSGFITSAQVPTIDDSSVSSTSVWSSYKTSGELATKANAAETTAALALKANSDDVYTKAQVDTALSDKADSADVYTKSEVDTSLSGKANIGSLFFGNAGTGFKAINGDATIDNIIDNNITSAGYFSIDHGGYLTNLVTTINRQFIYGWANSNRQYSWCLICTFGGIWYCKREGSTTYTATKLI